MPPRFPPEPLAPSIRSRGARRTESGAGGSPLTIRAIALSTVLAAITALAPSLPRAAVGTTLEVSFEGLPNDDGQALFALFASADGFPDRAEVALAREVADIVGGRARVFFQGVVPGHYALSALHDANGSGTIDLNLLGMPKEKFGVSNVAKGRPRWENASFGVAADAGVLVIRLRPLRYF